MKLFMLDGEDSKLVGDFQKREIERIIHAAAYTFNYGVFRHWTEDGFTFYDVGPFTYQVENEEKI